MINILVILLILFGIAFMFLIYTNTLNNVENLGNINKGININKQNKEIPSQIDGICNCKNDYVHIFKNKEYWKIKNGEIIEYNDNAQKIWNWPWGNIDTCVYDPNSKNILFIKDNEIYTSDKKRRTLNQYFKTQIPKKFNCVISYNNSFFFLKDDVYYEYKNQKISQQQKISNKWKNIPNNIQAAFINNNHIVEGVPYGMPCFVKDGIYYSYNVKDNSIQKKYIKTGLVNNLKKEVFSCLNGKGNIGPKDYMTVRYNTKLVNIKDELQHYKIPSDGLYRIVAIGAGNGGRGGKVFGDYELKKNDSLKILVGQQGTKLPMSNDIHDTTLPKTNSCSGSGASVVYCNDKILLTAGGGGGWCSEIFDPPSSSHSVPLVYRDNVYISHKKNCRKLNYIIKKIKIESLNNSSKIIVKNIEVSDDVNIVEFPKLKLDKKDYMCETDYSSYLNKPYIDIEFKYPKTDINMLLDYEIVSNKKTNNTITFYDHNDNIISKIINFNKKYKNHKITSNLIVSHSLGYMPKCIIDNNKEVSRNGGNLALCKNIDDFNKNSSIVNSKNVILKGGFGGGGACETNLKSNINNCGGGGGFMGGHGINLDLSKDFENSTYFIQENKDKLILDNDKSISIPLASGSGGSSFVRQMNPLYGDYSKYFINDYNEGNGKVEIIKLLENTDETTKNNSYIKNVYDIIKNDTLTPENPIKKLILDDAEQQDLNLKSGIDKFNIHFDDNKINNKLGRLSLDPPNLNNEKNNYELNYESGKLKNFIKIKLDSTKYDRIKLLLYTSQSTKLSIHYLIGNERKILFVDRPIQDAENEDLNMLNIKSNHYEELCSMGIANFPNKYNSDILLNNINRINIGKMSNIKSLYELEDRVFDIKNELLLDREIPNNSGYLYIYFSNMELSYKLAYMQYNSQDINKNFENILIDMCKKN